MIKLYRSSVGLMLSIFCKCVVIHANIYHEPVAEKPFYVAVDYLFWKAEEDQLQYALNIPGGFPKDGLVFAKEIIVKDQKFKPGSGVRLTMAYLFCNDWDASLAWTHFKKRSKASTSELNGGIFGITMLGLLDLGGIIGTDATSKWSLKFDTLDFEFANNACFFGPVFIRGHCGIKGARINQRQNINYSGISGGITLSLKRKNNFWGIGPRMGIDSNWYVWRTLSMVGNISASLLYGRFNIHADYSVADDPSLSPKFSEHKHRLRPTLQMLLGLNWEQKFCNIISEVGIGYEAQFWWSQWQNIPSPFALTSSILAAGDLILHGLTVHFGISF